MVTKVVNIKKEKYNVYIGRGSRLGNKYKISKDGTRFEVIKKYEIDFNWRLENESGFKEYVLSLKGFIFGCYCKPLLCHGDIIVEYLERDKG